MDELDHCGHFVVVAALISQRLSRHHHQGGAQAFAAAVDDVLGDLPDQGNLGMQSGPNDPIHLCHIFDEERLKQGLGHGWLAIGEWKLVLQRGIEPPTY